MRVRALASTPANSHRRDRKVDVLSATGTLTAPCDEVPELSCYTRIVQPVKGGK